MTTKTAPRITANGEKLANKLNPAIGTTGEIRGICSLIARHAKTHHWYCEADCNGPSYGGWTQEWQDQVDGRIEQLEQRITRLIEDLPATDDGPFGAYFQHDPRGVTVGLTCPGEWVQLYDGWGRDRINVELF